MKPASSCVGNFPFFEAAYHAIRWLQRKRVARTFDTRGRRTHRIESRSPTFFVPGLASNCRIWLVFPCWKFDQRKTWLWASTKLQGLSTPTAPFWGRRFVMWLLRRSTTLNIARIRYTFILSSRSDLVLAIWTQAISSNCTIIVIVKSILFGVLC